MIKIAIAEEHALVRKGFKSLLSEIPGFLVIAEADDGMRAIEIVEQLKPDVLVLGLNLAHIHGIEVIRRVRLDAAKTRIIVVSMHADTPQVSEALRAGADGYVLKIDTPEELKHAINLVMAGEVFISASLKSAALSAAFGTKSQRDDPLHQLTQRERTVLQLAAVGLTNAEIGRNLFISSRTVESHRANLMKKLDLVSQTDLVRFGVRRKIISA
jgi:DNA-binding NarL/FixJ family response regulator